MLKDMRDKPYLCDYTFPECCIHVILYVGAIFSGIGLSFTGFTALFTHSPLMLVLAVPCAVVSVLSWAGLIYVNAPKV